MNLLIGFNIRFTNQSKRLKINKFAANLFYHTIIKI